MDPRVTFNDILMRQDWSVERQNTTDWNYINKHFNAPAKTVSLSSQAFSQSLWSFMSEENLPDVSFLSHLCHQPSSDHVLDHVRGLVLVLNRSDSAARSVQDPSSSNTSF